MESEPLSKVVGAGNRLKSLEALRDVLASAIDNCESMRDLPPLASRLSDVLIQIESLTPKVEAGDAVDEITARRAARGAGPAKGSPRSTGSA